MGRVLVVDHGTSLLAEAIDRLMVRDEIIRSIPQVVRLVGRGPVFDPLPIYLPRAADEPKAGKVFHAGRYGAMPVPSGKRKKLKKWKR